MGRKKKKHKVSQTKGYQPEGDSNLNVVRPCDGHMADHIYSRELYAALATGTTSLTDICFGDVLKKIIAKVDSEKDQLGNIQTDRLVLAPAVSLWHAALFCSN